MRRATGSRCVNGGGSRATPDDGWWDTARVIATTRINPAKSLARFFCTFTRRPAYWSTVPYGQPPSLPRPRPATPTRPLIRKFYKYFKVRFSRFRSYFQASRRGNTRFLPPLTIRKPDLVIFAFPLSSGARSGKIEIIIKFEFESRTFARVKCHPRKYEITSS